MELNEDESDKLNAQNNAQLAIPTEDIFPTHRKENALKHVLSTLT